MKVEEYIEKMDRRQLLFALVLVTFFLIPIILMLLIQRFVTFYLTIGIGLALCLALHTVISMFFRHEAKRIVRLIEEEAHRNLATGKIQRRVGGKICSS